VATRAIAYKLPFQLKQPAETYFGYHLGYISLVVSAHLSTEPAIREGLSQFKLCLCYSQ